MINFVSNQAATFSPGLAAGVVSLPPTSISTPTPNPTPGPTLPQFLDVSPRFGAVSLTPTTLASSVNVQA